MIKNKNIPPQKKKKMENFRILILVPQAISEGSDEPGHQHCSAQALAARDDEERPIAHWVLANSYVSIKKVMKSKDNMDIQTNHINPLE